MPERKPGRSKEPLADPNEERNRLRAIIKSYRINIREASKELDIVRAREKSLCDIIESWNNMIKQHEEMINQLGKS